MLTNILIIQYRATRRSEDSVRGGENRAKRALFPAGGSFASSASVFSAARDEAP